MTTYHPGTEICVAHDVRHCLDCGYTWMSADELLAEVGES